MTSSTSTSIEWTSGGHGLLGAMPRSYQVTPEHPRPATSDTAKGGQTPTADSLKESQLAAGRDLLLSVGRHRQAESKQQASKYASRVALASLRRDARAADRVGWLAAVIGRVAVLLFVGVITH
jgi:hypothetical protein